MKLSRGVAIKFLRAVDPQDSNIVYAAAYERPYIGPFNPDNFGYLFKSTNGGTSWAGINSGSPNYVTAFAINPQTLNNLYAGTPFGVFQSSDGGANWDAINSGLTSPAVTPLANRSGRSQHAVC